MEKNKYKNLIEFVELNPKEKLPKNTIAKKIGMDKLSPFTKQIQGFSIEKYKGGSKFRKGDTLLARITPCLENGKTAQVTILGEDEIGFGSTEFIVLRAIKNISDKDYIYYLSLSNEFRNIAIKSMVGTSGRQRVQQSVLEQSKFFVPNLPTQKKIASILSALDDKIELNNKINKNLEEMAQAIFKSWFVDFEPWGGEMPDDWEYGKLGNIIEIYDSKRIPLSNRQRSTMKKIYPYYGATKIMDYVEDYIFEGTYILLGEDGTVSDEKGYPILQYTTDKFWVNNHTHVLKGKNNFNENSLYMLLRNIKVTEIITGAVQLKINQSNLKSIKIVIPSKTVLLHYNSIIDPIFNKKLKNDLENNNLIQIRDTLLPKLMSGEVDVSKLEI